MLRPGLIEQKTPLGFRLNSYILVGFVSKVSDFLLVERPASILAKLKKKNLFYDSAKCGPNGIQVALGVETTTLRI